VYLHDSSIVSSRTARRWNGCSPGSLRVLSYSGVFIWASWSTRAAIFFALLFDELNNFHPADARGFCTRQGRVLPLLTGMRLCKPYGALWKARFASSVKSAGAFFQPDAGPVVVEELDAALFQGELDPEQRAGVRLYCLW
jgi:hypothetical protein